MISSYLLVVYLVTSSGTVLAPSQPVQYSSEYECKAAAAQVLQHGGPEVHAQCVAQTK